MLSNRSLPAIQGMWIGETFYKTYYKPNKLYTSLVSYPRVIGIINIGKDVKSSADL